MLITKKLLAVGLWLLIAIPAPAQTTSQAFFNRYRPELLKRFSHVASENDLRFLLSHIVDRKNLEIDYNDYFRPSPGPLTQLLKQHRKTAAQQPVSASLFQLKYDLIFPLLRFVLPLSTAKPLLPTNHTGNRIANRAYYYLGVKYAPKSQGAFDRSREVGGLDCSGLVNYVFTDLGLPFRSGGGNRLVEQIVNSPDFVPVQGNPQPGDLLVRKHSNNVWSHVGIYVGNQQLIEAPYSGTVVRTTPYKPAKWHRTLRYSRK